MTNEEIGRLVLTLAVLVASVHGIGYLFERLRQPRLVGEILAIDLIIDRREMRDRLAALLALMMRAPQPAPDPAA